MKRLFVALLLANLAAAAGIQLSAARGTESMQAHQPINAEKVRLLDGKSLAALQPARKVAGVCMEWAALPADQLARARTALGGLGLGDRLEQRPVEEQKGYWVYIPPLRTKAEADRKVAELRGLGVTDYQVIQEGEKWLRAVSLGVFSTEDAARRQLTTLQRKGVRGARMDPRVVEAQKSALMLRDVDPTLEPKLVELKQEFPDTQLRAVACTSAAQAAAVAP